MRSKYLGYTLSLLGCALLGTVSVYAADRAPVRTVAQVEPSGNDGALSVYPQITSDKGKIKYAEEAIEEMREGLTALQKQIDEARKAKDIVYLNCLNEKYSSINALLKVTETASVLMQEALSQNNSQQADHQFRKVVIARFKARQFLQEAKECVSERGDSEDSSGDDATVEIESPITQDPKVDFDPVDPVIDPETPIDLSPAR